MKRILVPTRSGTDWQVRLAKPDLHWVPGKSAMSAAACWEDCASALPPEIAATLAASGDPALSALSLLIAVPEWEVALPGGSTSSCTDIMAIASNATGLAVIAVEAKVDEPFGPTLGEKRAAASAGQIERLDFLHRELGLSTQLPDDIHYQLLHRAVSAILTAREFHAPVAAMIVQSFSPESKWWTEFEKFGRALGSTLKPDVAAEIPAHRGPRLFLGWCAGESRFRDADLRTRA